MRNCAICAICTRELVSIERFEPLGRNNVMVAVCPACADEHPRSGRYSFEGGRATALNASTGMRANGNRRTSNKGNSGG